MGKGFASLALHVGLPVVGALVGHAATDCGSEGDGCNTATAPHFVVGAAIVATILDAALLSWTEVPKTPSSGVGPTFNVDKTSASIGLVGFF